MAIGIVGKKAGMTRIFTEEGQSIAVTVLEVTPNRVTQKLTVTVHYRLHMVRRKLLASTKQTLAILQKQMFSLVVACSSSVLKKNLLLVMN